MRMRSIHVPSPRAAIRRRFAALESLGLFVAGRQAGSMERNASAELGTRRLFFDDANASIRSKPSPFEPVCMAVAAGAIL